MPWTMKIYNVTTWARSKTPFCQENPVRAQESRRERSSKQGTTTWHYSTLADPPSTPGFLEVRSTFYSDADEIEDKPMLKQLTYQYENVNSWSDIGAQRLHSAGWRPDCVLPQKVNIDRVLPPQFPCWAPVVFPPEDPPHCDHREHNNRLGPSPPHQKTKLWRSS